MFPIFSKDDFNPALHKTDVPVAQPKYNQNDK